MHLANELSAKEFKLKHSFQKKKKKNTPFTLDNLIKYHHLGNLFIKVLNWFLFGKRSGKALLPVSQKLGSSPLRQASERQISSLRWAPGAAFRNPWKPDLPLPVRLSPRDLVMCGISWAGLFETPENLICLARQVFSLTALLGVGSRELTFSKPLKTWSALPIRFSPLWPC